MWNRLEDILKLIPDNQRIEIRVQAIRVYTTTFEGYARDARELARRGNYPNTIVVQLFSFDDPGTKEDTLCIELSNSTC